MRNDNQGRGPYSDEQSRRNPRGSQDDQFGSQDWQGGGYREQGQFRGSTPLFEDRQDRMNQFERSNYGHNERAGDYGRDPQYGGRNYGQNQFGEGADYSRGQHSSQRGNYGRGDYGRGQQQGQGGPGYDDDFGSRGEYGSDSSFNRPYRQGGQKYQGLRSRSADPGQSSYGGFTNEDTRYQHQQLDDYSGGREYGRESGPGQAYGREGNQYDWQSGAHQGRGRMQQRTMPKGYKRSDERLREDLCEQLSHSGLDVSEVSVEVSQGRVTLEGSVHDRRIKHAIEDKAAECMGVQEVENRIRVEHQSGNTQNESANASGQAMKSAAPSKPAQDNNKA